MTKFEKVSKRAQLLEAAFNTIIDADKWENMDYDSDVTKVMDGKEENHAFYLEVADEIVKLLVQK